MLKSIKNLKLYLLMVVVMAPTLAMSEDYKTVGPAVAQTTNTSIFNAKITSKPDLGNISGDAKIDRGTIIQDPGAMGGGNQPVQEPEQEQEPVNQPQQPAGPCPVLLPRQADGFNQNNILIRNGQIHFNDGSQRQVNQIYATSVVNSVTREITRWEVIIGDSNGCKYLFPQENQTGALVFSQSLYDAVWDLSKDFSAEILSCGGFDNSCISSVRMAMYLNR